MQNVNEILRTNILCLRQDAGLTQEALAQRLDITFQAVSKWENGLSCPDIGTLPLLADVFGVSLDALFGREAVSADRQPAIVRDLPWEDDGNTLHAVLYRGHRLLLETSDPQDREAFTFTYSGPAANIAAMMDVEIHGPVTGSITSNGDVEIEGDVQVDRVTAMGDLNCSGITAREGALRLDVMGDLDCGPIVCGSGASIKIQGDTDAGDITCSPESTLTAEGDLDCGSIAPREGALHLDVMGDLDCGPIVCGSGASIKIQGDMDAGDITCGPESTLTVEGDLDARNVFRE